MSGLGILPPLQPATPSMLSTPSKVNILDNETMGNLLVERIKIVS